jgi:hypothetical protein
MAQAYVNYASASDISITLASLASDTNLLAGQESSAVDNTVNKYRDYWVSGKITTGTSPTASRQIEVWAVGSIDGTLWPDVFDGTNSAETISSSSIKASVCRFVANMATTSTSNVNYEFGPVLLSSVFGGDIPPKWVLFVTHNTGVALNATSANHYIRLQPVYDTVS